MSRVTRLIQTALLLAAFGFVGIQLAVKVRWQVLMFQQGTECSERVAALQKSEAHWAKLARALTRNNSVLQGDMRDMRGQLVTLQAMHSKMKRAHEFDSLAAELPEAERLLQFRTQRGHLGALVGGGGAGGSKKVSDDEKNDDGGGGNDEDAGEAVEDEGGAGGSREGGGGKGGGGGGAGGGGAAGKVKASERATRAIERIRKHMQGGGSNAEEGTKADREGGAQDKEEEGEQQLAGKRAGRKGVTAGAKEQEQEQEQEEQEKEGEEEEGEGVGQQGPDVPPPPAAAGEVEVVAGVVVMACNRADYLDRTLRSILSHYNGDALLKAKFPLFISQDGTHADVKSKAAEFSASFTYMQHIETKVPKTERHGELVAYYRIANHYKWAFTQLFDKRNFSRVIVLEDDMEIAPDFFSYFEATAALLDEDSTLMAVSSWNDNGQRQFVHDPERVYRSDFFPGLGWMLGAPLWAELRAKWPRAYWDDWLRLQAQRRGRQFLRPEICRNYNFGEQGSSLGQFYAQFLQPIRLNNASVDWNRKDLSYLLGGLYPKIFSEEVATAKREASADAVAAMAALTQDVLLEYTSQQHFEQIARTFGIFEEWKDGVPRTAYDGVVAFRYKGPHLVFLASSAYIKKPKQS